MINKLKEIRLKNNFTQEYVAFKLGISQKAYSKIECKDHQLNHDKIIQLSQLYKVSPDYFCGISYVCSASKESAILEIKNSLKEKGLDFPDFS